jgi:hypothetical protein
METDFRFRLQPPFLDGKPSAGQRSNRRNPDPGKDHRPESLDQRTLFDPILRHDTCQTDPDLARIVDAWPTLPEAVRAGITAMVRAATK